MPDTNNGAVLGTAYVRQKPRSAKQWESIVDSDDAAQAFYAKLRKSKKLISKGEFAHDVASLINGGVEFTCPSYLDTAIRAVIETLHD